MPTALAELGFSLTADGRLHVVFAKSRTRLPLLLSAVQAAGLQVVDLETRESDLADLFLASTGRRSAPPPDEHAAREAPLPLSAAPPASPVARRRVSPGGHT